MSGAEDILVFRVLCAVVLVVAWGKLIFTLKADWREYLAWGVVGILATCALAWSLTN